MDSTSDSLSAVRFGPTLIRFGFGFDEDFPELDIDIVLCLSEFVDLFEFTIMVDHHLYCWSIGSIKSLPHTQLA